MSHSEHQRCGHCGEPHGQGLAYGVNIAGRQLAMCCAGCAAVASLIAGIGKTPDRNKREGDRRATGS